MSLFFHRFYIFYKSGTLGPESWFIWNSNLDSPATATGFKYIEYPKNESLCECRGRFLLFQKYCTFNSLHITDNNKIQRKYKVIIINLSIVSLVNHLQFMFIWVMDWTISGWYVRLNSISLLSNMKHTTVDRRKIQRKLFCCM